MRPYGLRRVCMADLTEILETTHREPEETIVRGLREEVVRIEVQVVDIDPCRHRRPIVGGGTLKVEGTIRAIAVAG
ncbi:MAG: hypothetical protein LBG52_05655 [Candidatus Peribacteria bacterium]|nr:hypothetical protein [Candidatus Peribacteria bacterium]